MSSTGVQIPEITGVSVPERPMLSTRVRPIFVRNVEAVGSNPITSTDLFRRRRRFCHPADAPAMQTTPAERRAPGESYGVGVKSSMV